MKVLFATAGLFVFVATANAQSLPSELTSPRKMRSLFGSLLIDADLQKELRMTPDQVKRMREIYLQYVNPATVVFSPWGTKHLGVTKEQRHRFYENGLVNNQKKMKIYMDNTGKYKIDDKLRIGNELDATFGRNSLSFLTRAQRETFERLKGKPYRMRNLVKKKRDKPGAPNRKPKR